MLAVAPRVFLPSVICVGGDVLRGCKRYSTGCLHCGLEGHFIRECPKLIGVETSVASLATPTLEMSTHKSSGRGFPSRRASAAAGRGGRGKGRGSAPGMQTEARTQDRVYVVTQQDADAAPDVVTGIISILDHDAYTLVDQEPRIHLHLSLSLIASR